MDAFLRVWRFASPIDDSQIRNNLPPDARATSVTHPRQNLPQEHTPRAVVYVPSLAQDKLDSFCDWVQQSLQGTAQTPPPNEINNLTARFGSGSALRSYSEEQLKRKMIYGLDAVCELSSHFDTLLPQIHQAGPVDVDLEQTFMGNLDANQHPISFRTRIDFGLSTNGQFKLIFEAKIPKASLPGGLFARAQAIFAQSPVQTLDSLAHQDSHVHSLFEKMCASLGTRNASHAIFVDYRSYFYARRVPCQTPDGNASFYLAISQLHTFTAPSPSFPILVTSTLYPGSEAPSAVGQRIEVVIATSPIPKASRLPKDIADLTDRFKSSRRKLFDKFSRIRNGKGQQASLDMADADEAGKPEDTAEWEGGDLLAWEALLSFRNFDQASHFSIFFPNSTAPRDNHFKVVDPTGITHAALSFRNGLVENSSQLSATKGTASFADDETPTILLLHTYIGSGAASHVYLADVGPTQLSGNMVVKVSRNSESTAMLLEHVKHAASLGDSGIAPRLVKVAISADKCYPLLVVEEYGGSSISSFEELSADEKEKLFDLAMELHLVHNLLHGDLRPDNVLVSSPNLSTDKRCIRIIDFSHAQSNHDCAPEMCPELRTLALDLGFD